jgi:hypothetical protein
MGGRPQISNRPALLSISFSHHGIDWLSPAQLEERKAAMMGIGGLWNDRTDLPDTETYVRNLRKCTRLERLEAL